MKENIYNMVYQEFITKNPYAKNNLEYLSEYRNGIINDYLNNVNISNKRLQDEFLKFLKFDDYKILKLLNNNEIENIIIKFHSRNGIVEEAFKQILENSDEKNPYSYKNIVDVIDDKIVAKLYKKFTNDAINSNKELYIISELKKVPYKLIIKNQTGIKKEEIIDVLKNSPIEVKNAQITLNGVHVYRDYDFLFNNLSVDDGKKLFNSNKALFFSEINGFYLTDLIKKKIVSIEEVRELIFKEIYRNNSINFISDVCKTFNQYDINMVFNEQLKDSCKNIIYNISIGQENIKDLSPFIMNLFEIDFDKVKYKTENYIFDTDGYYPLIVTGKQFMLINNFLSDIYRTDEQLFNYSYVLNQFNENDFNSTITVKKEFTSHTVNIKQLSNDVFIRNKINLNNEYDENNFNIKERINFFDYFKDYFSTEEKNNFAELLILHNALTLPEYELDMETGIKMMNIFECNPKIMEFLFKNTKNEQYQAYYEQKILQKSLTGANVHKIKKI